MHISLLQGLAILCLGGLAGGRLATVLRLPRVTGYLLLGIACGPSLAHLLQLPPLLDKQLLEQLRPLSQLALGLILFSIGSALKVAEMRRWPSRLLRFSGTEFGLTLVFVAGICGGLNLLVLQWQLPELSLVASCWVLGLLLGIIAGATAPAATLMVIREYEAVGPVTSRILSLVGLNNVLAVLLFSLAQILIHPAAHHSLAWQLGQQIGLPLACGGLGGLAVAVLSQYMDKGSERKLLLLGHAGMLLSLGHVLDFNAMLAMLVAGGLAANAAPNWNSLQQSLREIDYPLYVAFFVLAGARLHLEALEHIGLLGLAYVLARTLGKLLGAGAGAWWAGFDQRDRRFTGMALLAQAGVAIGLAHQLAQQWPAAGRQLETVVLGSVVVFELIGPLAVRFALVRVGEVPILSLLQKRASRNTWEGLHDVVNHFRAGLGLDPGRRIKDPGDILVAHIMRRNVDAIPNDMPFQELLQHIAHSRYDRFPVVNHQGRFVGMINYTEIRNLLYEPSLAQLIVAEDLVAPSHHAVTPDQTLNQAMALMQQKRHLTFFPVIDTEDKGKLLGMLSQNDVLAAFRSLKSSSS